MEEINKKEVEEKLKKLNDIKTMAASEGGKHVIAAAKKDVVTNIVTISSYYKNMTHPELMASCAELKANINLLKLLKGVDGNITELQKMLEELVEEM